jgi:hypothetical protein
VKYLRDFLEQGTPPTAKTARSLQAPLSAALAVLAGERLEVRATASSPQNRAPEAAAPCTECHGRTWLFLVADDGARTCLDCLTGRTALRVRGVPL